MSSPQVFDCGGGKVKSISITASNVTVQNCEVTAQQNGAFSQGIIVANGVSNITIYNNTIHDLCSDGIFFNWNVGSGNLVSHNTILHASMSGITVQGSGTTVDSNDISGTQQYPDRAGGVFAVCQEQSGADADAIRFFGTNHIIKNNYLHDIPWGTTVNVNPHIDCFQTWGAYSSGQGTQTSNILISGNHCVWPTTLTQNTDDEISSIEALNGSTTTGITYAANVFQNMRQGINWGGNVVTFDHNTVDNIAQEVLIFNSGGPGSSITNNIFYRHGGGGDEYTTSLAPTISNNNCTAPGGGACGNYPVNAPASAANPMFVNAGTSPSNPTNDYHLQVPASGAWGACGTDLTVACPPPQ